MSHSSKAFTRRHKYKLLILFLQVDTVRAIIKKELRPPQVLDIEDEEAKLDGSDVLFTGKYILRFLLYVKENPKIKKINKSVFSLKVISFEQLEVEN